MSKVEVVRAAMVQAMKAKDKARKESLSMLLSALKNAEIDKREPLTEAEENAVVKKEIKQTQETGAIMKVLMPRVKGKADGKVVNETLAGMFK